MKDRPLVLYHGNCPDGFTAAWAAWRWLGNGADYRAVNYGEPLPADCWGRSLYILDFSYPRDQLWPRTMDSSYLLGVTEFRVLDHHKTAMDDLAGLPGATFDLDHSGAFLAWSAFYHEPPPALVRYVEDRDLWRFALPESRAVSQWLRSQPYEFEAWSAAAERLERDFPAVAEEGRALLRFQDQAVSIMARRAFWVDLAGHRVPCVNATCFFSEVGEELCILHPDAPFSAYYFDRSETTRQWGLRSRRGFDCSSVAKQYGGGGHPGAAGFTTEVGWLPPVPAVPLSEAGA